MYTAPVPGRGRAFDTVLLYTALAGLAIPVGGVLARAGFLYLVFHDSVPFAHRAGHWLPTLGVIGDFLIGLVGIGCSPRDEAAQAYHLNGK